MLDILSNILETSKLDLIDQGNGIVVIKNPLVANLLLTKYQDIVVKESMLGWMRVRNLLSDDGKRSLFLEKNETKTYEQVVYPVVNNFLVRFKANLGNKDKIGLNDIKLNILVSMLNFFFNISLSEKYLSRFINACVEVEEYRSNSSWPLNEVCSSSLSKEVYLNALDEQVRIGKIILDEICKHKQDLEVSNDELEALIAFLIAMSSPISSVLFSSLCFNLRGVIDLKSAMLLHSESNVGKELFRYFSPAWFIVRRLKKTLKINGISIPRESSIFIPILYFHKNKEIWGEDFLLFNPGRFEDLTNIQVKSYLPFGRSERMCPASKFSNYFLVNVIEELVLLDMQLIEGKSCNSYYWTVLWRDVDCWIKRL